MIATVLQLIKQNNKCAEIFLTQTEKAVKEREKI